MSKNKSATDPLFLSLALLLPLGLAGLLYRRARRYYRQLEYCRLDPLGLNECPAGDSARLEISPGCQLAVFFGDSRAKEWPDPPGSGVYRFANRGISGQTTAQILGRFEAHVRPLEPDLLLVQAGINDLKSISVFPELKEEITTSCKANIAALIDRARAQGITVILTTIFPLGDTPIWRRSFKSRQVAAAILEANNFLYSLAGEGVTLFDTARLLGDPRGVVRREFQRDYLHLNAAGYAALNLELAKTLQTIEAGG